MQALPIDEILDDIVAAVDRRDGVVVQAPPGAGKTTRVPVALNRSASGKRIVMVQPRRVAARAAARRIADENGWQLGQEIGYQVRFDRRAGRETSILVVTEGIFLNMLQADPFLEDTGFVVFDEFHERNLDSDLGLAMCRRVQRDVRPDLKLIVMSATLDCEPVADYLGDAEIVTSDGRLFPVTTNYLEHPRDEDPARTAARAVRSLLASDSGDILVFLPGMAWINRCRHALSELERNPGTIVLRLHGSLDTAEQDRALRACPERKIVLATNIAETSVTIDGVRIVVDTGLARLMRYDRRRGMNRLETLRISRASADQRRGRAGRQGPGICQRLWTRAENHGLRRSESPEIQRLELSGPILQLLAWGENNLDAFPWFEPPPANAIAEALELLQRLGAINRSGLTALGRRMARIPTPPRLARMLIEGDSLGCLRDSATAAVIISEIHDPQRVNLWTLTEENHLSKYHEKVRSQLMHAASSKRADHTTSLKTDSNPLARAALAAFPDRLARRRPDDPHRAVMVGGQGLRLDSADGLRPHEFFLALDVMAGRQVERSEARVRLALPINDNDLESTHLSRAIEVEWDDDAERVRAFDRRRWLDLIISEHERPPSQHEASAAELLRQAAASPERAFELDRPAIRQFINRIQSLRHWRPELGLPVDITDWLVDMLPVLCQGRTSFAELQKLDLAAIIAGALDRQQHNGLERDAPKTLEVPSGSRVRLDYNADGSAPILRVRIQELFGLDRTPTVCGGAVPVMLHLLAPNMRPQQITDDLASFWHNTYHQIRSELRGRYPKHAWPENPLQASPTKGTKGARKRRTS